MDYTSYNLINTKSKASSSSSSTPTLIPSSYSRKPIIPRNGKHKASNKNITNNNNNNNNNNMNSKSRGRVRLSTDPQSVAARERRHRISDRFKMLQSLIPGGAKLDTVSMLDQAIQYVHFLKAQIKLHETIINNSNKVSNNNNNNNNGNDTSNNNQDHYDNPTLAYASNENSTSNTTVNDPYYYYYDQYCYALMNNNNNNNNSSNYYVSDQQQGGGGGRGGVNGGFCYDQKMINMAVTPNQSAQIHNLWGYQDYGQQSIDYTSHLV